MGIFCGVDMVEIQRVKDSIEQSGETFIKKVFTPGEIEYCENRKNGRYESYAARFAAKEAVSKALGTGFSEGVSLKGIELVAGKGGKPKVVLHGSTLERYSNMGGISMDISLTHSYNYAVAFAVLLTKDPETESGEVNVNGEKN
jgi:holo-[acyl-carrier protein] synthase